MSSIHRVNVTGMEQIRIDLTLTQPNPSIVGSRRKWKRKMEKTLRQSLCNYHHFNYWSFLHPGNDNINSRRRTRFCRDFAAFANVTCKNERVIIIQKAWVLDWVGWLGGCGWRVWMDKMISQRQRLQKAIWNQILSFQLIITFNVVALSHSARAFGRDSKISLLL